MFLASRNTLVNPASAPIKKRMITKKEVENNLSRKIPRNVHSKIGTIMLIPNCVIIVRARNTVFFFFKAPAPFVAVINEIIAFFIEKV